MKPSLKATLIDALEKWIEKSAGTPAWDKNDAFVHPELPDHMAAAAEAVYDATLASSRYTEGEINVTP